MTYFSPCYYSVCTSLSEAASYSYKHKHRQLAMALGSVEGERVGYLFGAADDACDVHGNGKQEQLLSFPIVRESVQREGNVVGVPQLQAAAGGVVVPGCLGPTATFRGMSSADEMVSVCSVAKLDRILCGLMTRGQVCFASVKKRINNANEPSCVASLASWGVHKPLWVAKEHHTKHSR